MKNLDRIIKNIIREATGDSSGSRGTYILPMQPGLRPWSGTSLGPYTKSVSKYDSPLLAYDSYDGSMDERLDQIKKIEKQASKITNYIRKHPSATFSDDDGNIINPFMSKEGLPSFKEKMEPFTEKVPFNEWVEVSDNGILNEDLAVWFGKKKKPKGSSQPKGPWVNICSKVDGKHPPCGRQDTSKGSYPKCRASGVASKMSDSQKRSACQQKRAAEKKDTQTGKGQKPIMTSYKPKNEEVKKIIKLTESNIRNIVVRVLNENIDLVNKKITKPSSSNGLNLLCVKLNLKNPSQSEASNSGPYPWSLVTYDKVSRPITLYLKRPSEMKPDRVFDTEMGEDIQIQFEEITDPKLKKVLTNKKYVMTTNNSPGVTGKQYCRVEGVMDPDWDTNLFSYGNNASVIDPFPNID